MTCRLLIDEVGIADVDHPNEQYFGLTGILAKVEFDNRRFTPEIETLKKGKCTPLTLESVRYVGLWIVFLMHLNYSSNTHCASCAARGRE